MDILSMTARDLADQFNAKYKKSAFHAHAVYKQVFKNGSTWFEDLPEFSNTNALALKIQEDLNLKTPEIVDRQNEARVVKFVTRLEDGLEIESVIVPMENHITLCVSCQVGCKMGCRFCETGNQGFARNLTISEIVGQVFAAKFKMGCNVRNIVYMGMGEPFDNFGNVIKSVRVLEDQRGFDIAQKNITISTVGNIDGIKQLAALGRPQIKLAVSLNAPDDAIRSKIMPVNHKFPMPELKKALMAFPLSRKNAIFFEYVLIKGINDKKEHAAGLARYLDGLKAKVNLIPLNPGKNSSFAPPSESGYNRFHGWLVDQKVFVRKRTAKGQNIMAGCGQLGNARVKSGCKATCCDLAS